MSSSETPSYVPIQVLFDETFHGRWEMSPSIDSMGNLASFYGRLEHHSPSTDGTFAICMAGGAGNFVTKVCFRPGFSSRLLTYEIYGQDLYESIPEAHRPPLRAEDKVNVTFSILGSSQQSVGSTIMPVILKNKDTGKLFCIKLHAYVMPNLLMGMFIGIPLSIMYACIHKSWAIF
jgi:hypothetical protein